MLKTDRREAARRDEGRKDAHKARSIIVGNSRPLCSLTNRGQVDPIPNGVQVLDKERRDSVVFKAVNGGRVNVQYSGKLLQCEQALSFADNAIG